MKIYLVDDNDKFRQTLKLFLEEYLSHIVVGEASDGQSFINTQVYADIILMDINMPHLNGLKTTKLSLWKNHEYKIIAVSQYKDNVDLHQLISAGFKGFVSKINLFEDLDKAIKTVCLGGYFFPDDVNIA